MAAGMPRSADLGASTLRLVLRNEFVQDLQGAHDWYEGERPGLSEEFRAEIDRTLSAIREHPLRFRVLVADLRHVLVRRFPYHVLYRIDGDLIQVVACYHGSRDPRHWMERG
jgi:plasmid stabilization system protein ParE